MEKLGLILLAMVVAVTLSGCSVPFIHKQAAPQLSEQDQAAEVVRKFVEAWLSLNYKDPQSFKAMDQYLVPSAAKTFDDKAAQMSSTLIEHKGYLTHGPIEVEFIRKDGDFYLFDAASTFSVNSDVEGVNKSQSKYEKVCVVSKQPDGKLLITDVLDPSKVTSK